MIKPYQVLATDYDGTLAHHGTVSAETLAAIGRLRAAGKKLVLVTGRELEELKSVFPEIRLWRPGGARAGDRRDGRTA